MTKEMTIDEYGILLAEYKALKRNMSPFNHGIVTEKPAQFDQWLARRNGILPILNANTHLGRVHA